MSSRSSIMLSAIVCGSRGRLPPRRSNIEYRLPAAIVSEMWRRPRRVISLERSADRDRQTSVTNGWLDRDARTPTTSGHLLFQAETQRLRANEGERPLAAHGA